MVDEGDFSARSVKLYEKEYRRSKLANSITNTGKGMWAVSKYAMHSDPIEAAESVLGELDAQTLNALIQGTAGIATYMSLISEFLPMVLKMGIGYLKAVAISGL